jgi:membrane protein YqaA with SNARE-associated domain
MIRKLYDWVLSLARHRNANWALAGVSFVESSVFPVPPDVLLIPMVLADRRKWIFLALLCTAASVLGGLLGYFIGAFLFDQVAEPILNFYGYMDKFDSFREIFSRWGWWFVFIAGLTPFPYKVITISSGVAGLSLPVFLIASLVSRGIRFAVVSGLLYAFGEPIRIFIEERLGLMFTIGVILLLGGFTAIKFMF